MVTPRIIKLFRMSGTDGKKEKIYCRRHNRLYSNCPVEEDLRLCECFAHCEVFLKAKGDGNGNGAASRASSN